MTDGGVECAGIQNLNQPAPRSDYLKWVARADPTQQMDHCTRLA
jgi:hypothetical protein